MITDLLTDDQMWELLGSPDVPSSDLAARFGIDAAQVRSIRFAVRTSGWCCRVDYTTCPHCGEPLVRQGFGKGRQRYHDACRPEALRTINATLHRSRWERTSPADREQRLERFHGYCDVRQSDTRQRATNAGARWQAEEDALVLEHEGNLTDVALQLGRSLYAVYNRRKALLARDQPQSPRRGLIHDGEG